MKPANSQILKKGMRNAKNDKPSQSKLFMDSTCELIYLLTFLCNYNPKTNTCGFSSVLHRHVQKGESSELSDGHLHSWGNTLPSCFSSQTISKHPFCNLFRTTLFAFLCFLVISLFKMAPKHNAKVLPSVPKCKKTGMPPRENTCVIQASFKNECFWLLSSMLLDQQNIFN